MVAAGPAQARAPAGGPLQRPRRGGSVRLSVRGSHRTEAAVAGASASSYARARGGRRRRPIRSGFELTDSPRPGPRYCSCPPPSPSTAPTLSLQSGGATGELSTVGGGDPGHPTVDGGPRDQPPSMQGGTSGMEVLREEAPRKLPPGSVVGTGSEESTSECSDAGPQSTTILQYAGGPQESVLDTVQGEDTAGGALVGKQTTRKAPKLRSRAAEAGESPKTLLTVSPP